MIRTYSQTYHVCFKDQFGNPIGNKTRLPTKILKIKQNVNVAKYNATAKRGNLNSARIESRE